MTANLALISRLIRPTFQKEQNMPEFIEIVETKSPFDLFTTWFEEAKQTEPVDPNAMILATFGENGFPTARAMLMKSYDETGIVFYTNQQSRKSDQIRGHDKAALCFYWKSLFRQVHFEGYVEPVSSAESDAYFATRPRESQIGAWASNQSRPLSCRAELQERIKALTAQYEGKLVPRPPHWGGYRLSPLRIEFWSGHQYRLHDRLVYQRTEADAPWTTQRLNP